MDYIYHFNFDSAKIIFDDIIKQNPKKPEGYFGLTILEWWKLYVDLNIETYDESFYNKVDKVVDICDEILDNNNNDENALLFKGGALGYKGLLKGLRKSWLKAAEEGKNALNLLQKVLEINPDNKDALFGIGTYNYYAEYIPEEEPLLKPLTFIFPKGDKIKGLLQLKEASKFSLYSSVEAEFKLVQIYLNYEKNFPEAENYANDLFAKFPENPVFEKYLGECYSFQSKLSDAIKVWKSILDKSLKKQFGYDVPSLQREAYYYLALSNFWQMNYNDAEYYLNRSEELIKTVDGERETAYAAYTYLMLGMIYDKKGDVMKADSYYDKVLSMKKFGTSHEEAKKLKKERFK
jgi:tetratricopeptide (TPR) repeat protein